MGGDILVHGGAFDVDDPEDVSCPDMSDTDGEEYEDKDVMFSYLRVRLL